MNPYDIERIFKEIEEEIISKMIDNFRKIRAKGKQGEYNWQEWRLKQLKAIKKFIKSIKGDYEETYKELNTAVSDNIEKSFDDTLVQDIEQAVESTETDRFSYINRTRMEALQKATTDDLQRVESAVFRKAEDEYRQIVYKAQVALNSGTVTYDQAVDMATRDLLNAGINCVVYKNGARHTVKNYASMVLRTTMKRASLMAEGEMRTQSGVHTVYAKFREEACPLCLPWLGRLMVDDVYSVGTREEADELGAYLLSEAMRWGFLHPNCKDTVATYYPYLWEDDPEHDPLKIHANKRMEYEAIQRQKIENKLTNAKGNVEKYTRRADNSLSPLNRQQAEARRDEWQGRQEALEQQLDNATERESRIVEWEERIRYNDFETGINFDEQGNVIFRREGQRSSINYGDLTDDERELYFHNKYFTHNHPHSRTMSMEDIKLATTFGVKEMRVTSRDYDYRLKRVGLASPQFAYNYEVATQNYMEDVTTPIFNRTQTQYMNGELNREEYEAQVDKLNEMVEEFRRGWLSDNAEKYGWQYTQQKRD